MLNIIRSEGEVVSAELVGLLRLVDPAAFQAERERELRGRLQAIARRLEGMLARIESAPLDGRIAALRERMQGLLGAIEAETPAEAASSRAAWVSFQRAVQPAYEALAASLRALSVPAASVRPTNYKRNAFHVASGLVAFTLLQALSRPGSVALVAGAFAALAWSLETTRRRSERLNAFLMRVLGPVAHPHERHKVNSATWFTTALFLLALLFSRASCSVAVLVLALGDTAAALVGRRFGRTRIADGRSLEGTLAFFVVSGAGTALALALVLGLPAQAAVALAAAGAGTGALVELFSGKIDDNLTIPLAAAAAAGAAGALLGV